ncbi:MAG: 50S ribosomal protein L25 [Candidatus Pacebacteria bacterium]|nr:50S ribosomal protein L25 [Candidatus Paceibacterota bacterium]
MTETLQVRVREGKKSLKELRGGKEMPAVFYGPKEEATPIALEVDAFKKLWKEAGESTVIELKGDGIDKEVLIQDVDFHPVTGEPRHADFYVMEKGKKVTVKVPIEFVGVAPAVKELGGILVKVLHEIEIEVMPKDLPQHIEVDVEVLKDFESHILAKDVAIPESATLITNEEEAVALVNEAKEEKEEETSEASIEDIEVERKGKKEEEETPTE